jgi:pimeloyl-ACP methyl ester carboxylesterase
MQTKTRELLSQFPVGQCAMHPDANFTFQMNRWSSWGCDPAMKVEMEEVSPRIHCIADWVTEFSALSERASAGGEARKAAFYARAAEFFMDSDDPRRRGYRDLFTSTVRREAGLNEADILRVPYKAGGPRASLPALRFGKGGPRGALLLFGGFDSCFEELIHVAGCFASEGFDVVLFEGPGQGEALEAGIPMTHRWELPVAAVLDAFGLSEAVVIGGSLGGYLALRAAAFEPRVRAVVAWDIIYDFFEVLLSQLPAFTRSLARACLGARLAVPVNIALRARMRSSPVAAWGVKQGMRVFGETSPSGFLRAAARCETASFSENIRCDTLLLAGAEDHFVPLEMLHRQARAITSARSLTTRVFSVQESAQAHCQTGNLALALRVIIEWLESIG